MIFTATPNVISKKIQSNHPFLSTKSFVASFGIHAALVAGVSYWLNIHPAPLPKPESTIAISFSGFSSMKGEMHRHESDFRSFPLPPKTVQPHPQSKASAMTPEGAPSLIPSVSPEASAPLASVPMPASSPSAKSIDSPHTTSSAPVHELPKPPVSGNDISGAALGHIRAMIEKAATYPTIARKLRLEGVVTVFFILNADGTVDQANISSTSGSKILDDKALSTILSLSGDYPALGKTVELRIPVAFRLSSYQI